MIDVLVVEDSRVIRDYLVFLLESDPELRVVGAVSSGEEALGFVQKRRPDVILMDVHLPGIDGFETTRQILTTVAVPIVICTSSVSFSDVQTALHAIEAGALAALKKPKGFGDPDGEAEGAEIIKTVKVMSEVKVIRRWNRAPAVRSPLPAVGISPAPGQEFAVVAIGASTGGPPAIMKILTALPRGFPVPILIVQHIASGFSLGFAEWLASQSPLPVVLARSGVVPLPGHVYIAPDDVHLRVGRGGELLTTQGDPQNGLRPSVGNLFRSVAERFGRRSIAVLLTGMGRDGAEELKLLADLGACTIAQDEQSSVVFGMPAEAIRLGAARYVLSPEQIAEFLIRAGNGGKGRK